MARGVGLTSITRATAYTPTIRRSGTTTTTSSPTSTELVMPGDIFQGAGTAGYTTDGTMATMKPDASAMDKAAMATGGGIPTWLWIVGGVGAAGALAWFFFFRRGGSSFKGM